MFTTSEKKLISTLTLIHFCLIVDFMLLMPLGSIIMESFSISAKQFSSLIGVHTLISGFSGILAAISIDSIDRRKLCLYSQVGLIIASITAFYSQDFTLLLVARSISGFLVGILGSLILILVSQEVRFEKRGTAIGIIMSAFAMAAIVGIPVSLKLANLYGWNYAFIFLILIALISIIVTTKNLILAPINKVKFSLKKSLHELGALLVKKNRTLALLFLVFLILGHFSIIPFLFPSIINNAKISQEQLPVIYLVGGIVSIASSILFGILSDKWSIKKTFSISLLLSIPVIYYITRLVPSSLPTIILSVSAFYLVMNGRMTPAMTLISSTTSQHTKGKFMSIVSALNHFTAGIAAIIAGSFVVKDEVNKTLFGFEKVGYFAILFSILALITIYFVKREDEGQ